MTKPSDTMNKRMQEFFIPLLEQLDDGDAKREVAVLLQVIEQGRPREQVTTQLLRVVQSLEYDPKILSALNDAISEDLKREACGAGKSSDPLELYREFADLLTRILLLSPGCSRGILLQALRGTLEYKNLRRQRMEQIGNETLRGTVVALDDGMMDIAEIIASCWDALDQGAEKLVEQDKKEQ